MWAVTALVGVFLLLPIAVVVLFSFNSKKSLNSFEQPSLHWYAALFDNSDLLASVRVSLEIAAVTSVVATVLGTIFAFGLARSRTRWSRPPQTVLIATLVTPEIATAVALFLVFTSGLHWNLSTTTVILGHITFSLVYVTLVVRTRLAGLRPEVEEAAKDLGCTEWQAIRLVMLPQLAPAIVGAALLVFVLSFDDFVTSTFTTGAGTSPLPVYIYGAIKFGLSPEINAVGSLMLLVTLVLGTAGIVLTRASSRRSRS
ncbi:ABC transporter permease [Cryptosporangium phraense]|uniref:ABC transporter permease n=1 Tax=Cryptosporangium phraense TaxID=2593070 RepID=A0A545AU84_9ACTN|nr:ABC transporter permease [Cryptosporangium phraense]